MSLLLILVLVVIAVVVSSLLKWRRCGQVFALLAVALFFAIGCGPLPSALLRDLQAGYSANAVVHEAASTTIIVLGAGTEWVKGPDGARAEVPLFAYGRVVKALELYRACRVKNTHCTVLVSGGDPQHHGVSEAAVYGAQLQKIGVDPADLLIEGRSLNTWQNAQYTAALLREHPSEQLFLVTSGFHLRRSELYFRRLGVVGQAVRSDYVDAIWGLVPMAYDFELADIALHEYLGVVRYFFYEGMGWNGG